MLRLLVLAAIAGAFWTDEKLFTWPRALLATYVADDALRVVVQEGRRSDRSVSVCCNSILSATHATWASVASVYLLLHVHADHVPTEPLARTASVFLAYLSWDLTHLLTEPRFLRVPWKYVLHHLAYIGLVLVNRDTVEFNYVFPLLYVQDLSSVFLNLRRICHEFGWDDTYVSLTFVVTFFLMRVVLHGAVVVHVLANSRLLGQTVPIGVWSAYVLGVPVMYGLNLVWWSHIVRHARAR